MARREPRRRFRGLVLGYRFASLRRRERVGRGVEWRGAARSNESRRSSRRSISWASFGVGCLIEGPVKLDVFFEREGGLASRPRIAVKRLWGAPEIYERFKIGDDLGDAAIKHALESNVLGFLQGATWPVRILARGQINTFLFNEILLVETAIVPLMLLETDRRAFHRNMFTRAKLLPPESARRMRAAGRSNRNVGAQRRSRRDARRAYRDPPKDLRTCEGSIRALRSGVPAARRKLKWSPSTNASGQM